MKKNDDPQTTPDFHLPRTSAADLRGKQSVRATFKLTEKAIGALSIVSVHLGIKQKSLFDHLMEDIEALRSIATRLETEHFDRRESIQKTYVLSRKTLSSLEQASKAFDTPRDALVEYSIQRLMPVIVKEKKKHRDRKTLLAEMTRRLEGEMHLLNDARRSLGEDDPVYRQIESAVSALASACDNVAAFIQRGSIIENF